MLYSTITGVPHIVFVLTRLACARVGGTHLQDAGPVPMPHAGAGCGLGLFGYRTHVVSSHPLAQGGIRKAYAVMKEVMYSLYMLNTTSVKHYTDICTGIHTGSSSER